MTTTAERSRVRDRLARRVIAAALPPVLALLLILALAASPAPVFAHASSPVVALFTDYGTSDQYVGVLKGVILSDCPDARIVDLTHEVPSYDIRTGARLLYLSAREFPPASVIVAVVDPGVGTERRPIALQTRSGMRFVAPDNGLLTLVADSLGVAAAHVISNPAFMATSRPISSTFHGRDIFAPAAAYLACGTAIDRLGPPAGEIVRLDFPVPVVAEGLVRGEVDRVDVYGNVLTNISAEHLGRIGLAPGDTLRVTIGKDEGLYPWKHTYGDVAVGSRVAVLASAGELELAVNQGNLGGIMNAARGTIVEVRGAARR